MPPEITVRKARKGDSSSFIDLVVALAHFEHLAPPDAAAKKRLVRDTFVGKKLNLFLAFVGNRAVGYSLYFFTYSSFLAMPTLYLEDLFVLEEFRRLGIGKNLFLACIDEARKKKCGRMEWSVLTWNKKAIAFYEKMGARRLKEWHYYRLDGNALGKASLSSD